MGLASMVRWNLKNNFLAANTQDVKVHTVGRNEENGDEDKLKCL